MLTEAMIHELRQLEKEGRGELRTEAIVTLARKPSSALHKYSGFEWDIKKAAYAHWMETARGLVQVYVGIIKDGDQSKQMRKFVHIRTAEGEPAYRATEKVLIENRNFIVQMVANRILSAIGSYPLKEFDPIIALVEEIKNGEMVEAAT